MSVLNNFYAILSFTDVTRHISNVSLLSIKKFPIKCSNFNF